MNKIRVVAGILIANGTVLAAQRGPGMRNPGKWEFPGGKVEDGESDAEALARELWEELSIEVKVVGELIESTHSYPDQTICLVGLHAHVVRGEPVLSEHSSVRWVSIPNLDELDWSDADLPIVRALMEQR